MSASSRSGSRRFRPRARDLVSSAMNVENSKEADPVRAEAVAGPAKVAQMDVALILSCIRVGRAKRRLVTGYWQHRSVALCRVSESHSAVKSYVVSWLSAVPALRFRHGGIGVNQTCAGKFIHHTLGGRESCLSRGPAARTRRIGHTLRRQAYWGRRNRARPAAYRLATSLWIRGRCAPARSATGESDFGEAS